MADQTTDIYAGTLRADWIRLRTLVILRWLAVIGQTVAVGVATFALNLDLRLDLIFTAIGISVLFNIYSSFRNPRNKRLREGNAAVAMLFDLAQLNALLYLTGGLSNPFCFLVLAPITISATALSLPTTILLGFATLFMITLLIPLHQPLVTFAGEIIVQPTIFVFGTWVSLIVGCIFVASYARRVTVENQLMSQGLSATQMALERERKLTELGGVVAAAAHELGSPLATIKLVSAELEEELSGHPELLEDAKLIKEQAERCRHILHDMGRAGRDDRLMRVAPLLAVIEEAAEPHKQRGRAVFVRVNGTPAADVPDQPQIERRPEVIHGLRNLVQNGVDFAASAVWIDVSWDAETIAISVGDDGSGYPHDLIGQIGDPFLSRRGSARHDNRLGYEGMGLGLFIASTLLERSGAQVSFKNAAYLRQQKGPMELRKPTGALAIAIWPMEKLAVDTAETRQPLGRNTLNVP